MATHKLEPRCSIEIINDEGKVVMVEDGNGQMVPILDWGASIEPAGPHHAQYREVWTEEEDLIYTYQPTTPEGSPPVALVDDIHGNFGYTLTVRGKNQKATLEVGYFAAIPSVVDGKLSLGYEPKSVTVTGSLKNGTGLKLEVELPRGLSEARGRPFFKLLRVVCR